MHCAVVCAYAGTEKIKTAMGALDLERIAQALEVYGPTAGVELLADARRLRKTIRCKVRRLESVRSKAAECQIALKVPQLMDTLINCCNSEQLQQAILDARELQGFDPMLDTKRLAVGY